MARKKHPPLDPERAELIARIKKIYSDNEHQYQIDLRDFSAKELRIHLNRLQWGQIPYITRLNILPEPDEYPPDGFKCEQKIWTNIESCALRSRYVEIYPMCRGCRHLHDQRQEEETDKSIEQKSER